MLRLRASPLVLVLLFACKGKAEPEPLASYGADRLSVIRGTDVRGTPIVFAYLVPRDGDGDGDCAPLAPVRAQIDGRSLAVDSGGGPGTCFGASFKAPLVVLEDGVDFHELTISDDGARIRASVADLGTSAELGALSSDVGDEVRIAFDRFVRGRIEEAHATWSATERGDVRIEPAGDTVVAFVPSAVDRSGRVVLEVDLVVDLEVAACEGIPDCEAKWLVHEVFDVGITR